MATWNVTAARGKKVRQAANIQTQAWDDSLAWMGTASWMGTVPWLWTEERDGSEGWDEMAMPVQNVSRGKKAARAQMEEQVQTVAWNMLFAWDEMAMPVQNVSRGKKSVWSQMEEQVQTVVGNKLFEWDEMAMPVQNVSRGKKAARAQMEEQIQTVAGNRLFAWDEMAMPVQKMSRGKSVARGQNAGGSSSAENLWYGTSAKAKIDSRVEKFTCLGRGTLRLLQVNCRSIKTKVEDLDKLIEVHRPDVIIGTESWLTEDVHTSTIFHSDFVTHRRDRNYGTGGGIFICIHKNLRVSEVSADRNFEILSVKLRAKTAGNSISVIAAYRSPKENFAFVQKLVELTQRAGRVVVGGDLNLPEVSWKGNAQSRSAVQALVNQLVWANGLTQVVDAPTRGDAVLDVFLVRPQELALGHSVVSGISDHKGVLLVVQLGNGSSGDRSGQIASRDRIQKEQVLNDLNDILQDLFYI